jgi:hypothetical protein
MADDISKEIEALTAATKSLRQSANAYATNAKKVEKKIDKNRQAVADSEESYNSTADQFKKYGFILKESVQLAKAEQTERKAGKLKKLEEKREKKEKAKEEGRDFELPKQIKEASFIQKLGKLAFGIVGAAAFAMVVKNFDAVKAFFQEKLVPATAGILTFMRDTALPFIVDNFGGIAKGIVGIAAAIVGAKVVIKVYNAVSTMITAFSSFAGGLMKVMRILRIGKALTMLRTAFTVFRIFMLKTLVPGLIGAFTSAMTAMAPVVVALAPFIAAAAGIALAVGLIYLGLEKVRESLGFESIFDVMMLGAMHLKDAFATVVNFLGSIVNKVLSIASEFGKFLGFDVNLPEIPVMATDSAEKFKAEALAKVEAKKKEKEEQEAKQQEVEAPPENAFQRKLRKQEETRARLQSIASGQQTVLKTREATAPELKTREVTAPELKTREVTAPELKTKPMNDATREFLAFADSEEGKAEFARNRAKAAADFQKMEQRAVLANAERERGLRSPDELARRRSQLARNEGRLASMSPEMLNTNQGALTQKRVEELQRQIKVLEARQATGGGATVIAPQTTTNNNQSSSAVYGDPSPATDDLDRVSDGFHIA